MMVLGVEIPDELKFDYTTGHLMRRAELPLIAVMQLAGNTPCQVSVDDHPCGAYISVSTARRAAPRAGHQDEFDVTGGWRCQTGHGPKQLARG